MDSRLGEKAGQYMAGRNFDTIQFKCKIRKTIPTCISTLLSMQSLEILASQTETRVNRGHLTLRQPLA